MRRLPLVFALFLALLPRTAGAGTEELWKQANELRIKGEYKQALAAYQELYSDPKTPPALQPKAGYLVGWCYEAMEDYRAALKAYRALQVRFSDSRPARNASFRVKMLARYEAGGFAKYKAQSKISSLIDDDHWAEVIKILQGLGYNAPPKPDAGPLDRDFYFVLGDCYRKFERYPEAVLAYQRALNLGHPEGEMYRDRALRYILRGRLALGGWLALGLLGLAYLSCRPWRALDRHFGKAALIGSLVWLALAGFLLLFAQHLQAWEDHEKPVGALALLTFLAWLVLPAVTAASLARARRLDGHSALAAGLQGALFGCLGTLTAAILVADARDWFMIFGL